MQSRRFASAPQRRWSTAGKCTTNRTVRPPNAPRRPPRPSADPQWRARAAGGLASRRAPRISRNVAPREASQAQTARAPHDGRRRTWYGRARPAGDAARGRRPPEAQRRSRSGQRSAFGDGGGARAGPGAARGCSPPPRHTQSEPHAPRARAPARLAAREQAQSTKMSKIVRTDAPTGRQQPFQRLAVRRWAAARHTERGRVPRTGMRCRNSPQHRAEFGFQAFANRTAASGVHSRQMYN